MNVLFVCTGNTCRSPMAEALLKDKKIEANVQSAGIFADDGAPMSEFAHQVLRDRGISTHHLSQPVTEALLEEADIVIGMTKSHQMLLKSTYPAYQHKIHLLKHYMANNTDHIDPDITDPFGQDLPAYQSTLLELEKYVSKLAEKIENRG